jgi:hypothetical protein
MGASKPQSFALAFVQGRNINAADVIALLREVYADGIATRDEAEELIAFDRALQEPAPGWCEFFAVAIADHLLEREAPVGTIDESKTEWLTGSLLRGRPVATAGGFAAMLRVMENVRDPAPLLSARVIEQVRLALISGEGRRLGLSSAPRRIVDADATAMLGRALLAGGGSAGAAVSRAEAEALFDLHDAFAQAGNDPAFEQLFFAAIACHLVGAAGGAVPPRASALAADAAREKDPTSLEFSLPDSYADSVRLDPDQIAWLASRIMRDGRPTGAEFALLRLFTGQPCNNDPTPPSLDRAA